MSKEQEPVPASEKVKSFAKKALAWAIIVGGAAVGLQWFIGITAGL
jgi:hypothetical protein